MINIIQSRFSKILAALIIAVMFTGCVSPNSGNNPLNRSILFDTGLKIGLDIPIIPIPLPKINIALKFHLRRLSPQEEIDIELAKRGKYRGMNIPKKSPIASPTPFRFEEKKEEPVE